MAAIKWLPEALDDIERFLTSKHPQAAKASAQVILEGAEILQTSPRMGRLMANETQRRELFLSYGSGGYVLRYVLEDDDTVVIIRVWHSQENRHNIMLH